MHAVSAVMFFPRGGSAHVARALATELPARGWDVTLVAGSLPGGHGDAEAFYAGLDLVAVDFDAGDAPMHPSFEDRPGAPDPCVATLDDAAYEAHVAAWALALERAGAADADVLHLHHLTPVNEAAQRVAPGVPVVGHLHGTELLLLEAIAAGAPPTWPHAAAWARRMRRWARRCAVLVVPTPAQVPRACELLAVPRTAVVVVPNGVDGEAFRPEPVDRAAFWHEHLVEAPRGWRPGAAAGSVAYTAPEIARLADGPVLLSVGRFTAVKRTGLLIRAFARAAVPGASLVIVGGHPGEWEGEHPSAAIAAVGPAGAAVFLAGWHDHDALPGFLNAADVLALASVREQFGLVLIEAMACGLPVVAVDRLGPREIVDPGRTGWLVEPDDEAGLAAALREALQDGAERERRGERAQAVALERYGWPRAASTLAAAFDAASAGAGAGARVTASR